MTQSAGPRRAAPLVMPLRILLVNLVLLGLLACTEETASPVVGAAGGTGLAGAGGTKQGTAGAGGEAGVGGGNGGAAGGTPPGEQRSLRHFGFVGVSCGLDDPHDAEKKGDYLDEVKGFTDLAHACAVSPSQDLSGLSAASKSAGVGLVLQVQPLLFDSAADKSSPSGTRVRLRQDARQRWQTFTAKNPDLSAVSVLYPVDEPFWNGCSAEDLREAFAILEETLPQTTKLLIEAYAALDKLDIPAEVDWLGFDRYDTLKPGEDKAFLADLTTMRKKKRPDQKLVLIMDSQWRPHYGDAGVAPGQMNIPAESLFELALSSDDVVAILGYLWPGGLDEPAQLGARDLPPSVQDVYRSMGHKILSPP